MPKSKQKAQERFAARAKIARDASAEAWRAEVADAVRYEARRQKRIRARGVLIADLKEVLQLARNMCGGIGPRGIALEGTAAEVAAEVTEGAGKIAWYSRGGDA